MGRNRKGALPGYLLHKATGQGYVKLNGMPYYCGPYGSAASRQKYSRLISEWTASGRVQHGGQDGPTITAVAVGHMEWALEHYRRPDGTRTNESGNIRIALRLLRRLYGTTPARDFGPLQLQTVREAMVKRGWSRPYCNKQTGRICRMFRWAAARALVPGSLWHDLKAVDPLERGRCGASDPEPVAPVADAAVSAILPYCTPTLSAMIRLQQATGMRPGELVIMRTRDIDTSGTVWIYRPLQHKTAYRGKTREVYISPEGQKILKPWLRPDLEAYLFSPAQSDRERHEALHEKRVTPMNQGNKPGSHVKADRARPLGECYDTQSYGRAIAYACDAAWPLPPDLRRETGETHAKWRQRLGSRWVEVLAWRKDHRWAPNRLRHSFATRVRKQYGLEAAQILLGHASADITQIYAERDRERGIQLAARMG